MSTIAEIERDVMELPDDQRLALINRVLETSDPADSSEVQQLWDDEIIKRIELLDKGLTQQIPVSDVFRELDQKFE